MNFFNYIFTNQQTPVQQWDIQEKVYNNSLGYQSKNITHAQTANTLSCPPSAPQGNYQQSVMNIPNQNFQQFIQERLLTPIDRRIRVDNITRFPNSIHAQLEMNFNDGAYAGSGALVGPHHVLTCAHNVYSITHNYWANQIFVYPGRDGLVAPFGRANVTRAYIFSNWTQNKDERLDIALLILDRSIGKFTGWGGLLSTNDQDLRNEEVQITGYPGDKGFGQMWGMKDKIKTIAEETFDYQIDTYFGQSGSAIWIEKWGQPFIVGVHTTGGTNSNSGVRISPKKFTNLLANIISGTYNLIDTSTVNPAPFVHTTNFQQPQVPEMAFGKAQWEKYFGDVGVEPPLPANINEILESPCPFWPNKKVHDTHLLVLIPKYVNGKLLTLNTLQELIQSPQKGGYGTKYSYYYDIAEKEIGSHPVSSSYWALITKDVLLNSRKKTYSEQQSLINSPYVVPNSLEIVTGILMHYAETGERLYSDNPSTYTRCQEMLSNGYRMIISFRSSGLEVCNHGYFSTDNRKDLDGIGCGAMRRF